jgi:HTH-type transcriptional regulator/antitoxin HigA
MEEEMTATLDIQRLVPAWQSLQSVAAVTHIDSEAAYAQTVTLLNNLLDVVRDDTQHPLYSLVSVVGDLIEAYEIEHEPLEN